MDCLEMTAAERRGGKAVKDLTEMSEADLHKERHDRDVEVGRYIPLDGTTEVRRQSALARRREIQKELETRRLNEQEARP
jgi:hypothetical protein